MTGTHEASGHVVTRPTGGLGHTQQLSRRLGELTVERIGALSFGAGQREGPIVSDVDLGEGADAARLLAGPRGRALCAAIAGLDGDRLLHALERPTSGVRYQAVEAQHAGRPWWPPPGWDVVKRRSREAEAHPLPEPSEVLAGVVAAIDLEVLAEVRDELAFVPSLVEAVDDVMFSGDEASVREVLASAADVLVPVAEALVRAPGASWWWGPCDRGAQRWICFSDGPDHPLLVGAREALADWARSEADDEARSAGRVPFPPRGRSLRYSGTWWSIPACRLVRTTRVLPGLPAVGLALMEDSPPDDAVAVWEVTLSPDAEVFEVDGAGAWRELTERFPREVTRSRRFNWWRWSGFEGRWFLPDWAKVADAFDAVHLSVAGHLEASYRALPVPGGATFLAGFDPDETIWLTDAVGAARRVEAWEGDIGRNRFQDRTRAWLEGGRPGGGLGG